MRFIDNLHFNPNDSYRGGCLHCNSQDVDIENEKYDDELNMAEVIYSCHTCGKSFCLIGETLCDE